MDRKLTLDVDALEVLSFQAGEVEEGLGTVRARELNAAAAGVTQTTCALTTPCCVTPNISCP